LKSFCHLRWRWRGEKLEQGIPEYLYAAAVVVSGGYGPSFYPYMFVEQFKYDVVASEQHYGVGAAEFRWIGFQRRGWGGFSAADLVAWWRRFLNDCRCASLTHFSRT